MNAALLSCPFCGGPARRSKGGEGENTWYGTGCDGEQTCPAYLRAMTHKTPESADAAWNTRAPQAKRTST